MLTIHKWHYCPECKAYPNEIITTYDSYEERLAWNESVEDYIVDYVESYGNEVETYCGICGTICEYKPGENANG